jgi:dihydropteroate synthase
MDLRLGNYMLDLNRRPHVMGVLNVTPDSFWDGGRYSDVDRAVLGAEQMVADGADIIDVGGESTRPNSKSISAEEEIDRIAPVVERILRDLEIPISIDTRKSIVAQQMLDLGAHMINDVSGLAFDAAMPGVLAEYNIPVVVMHMRGTPDSMQRLTDYDDVVDDVRRELAEKVALAERCGIRPENVIIDPGIGFAKTAEQCVELVARLDEMLELDKPILVGPSRKSFMGKTLGLNAEDRLEATIAASMMAVRKGASIVRVHDVAPVKRALRMLCEIADYERPRDARVLS